MRFLRTLARAPLTAWRFIRLYSQHLPLAYEAIFSMPCTVMKIHGTLRGANEQLTILYIGRGKNYDYLLRTIFEDHRSAEDVQTNLFTFRKHVHAMREDAGVEIVDIGWPYNFLINRKREYLEVPDWVNLTVDLPERWEDVVGNFRRTARRHDLRLIRRNGYRCEPAESIEAIERFYDEMYLPFIRHRHPGDAVAAPRRHVVDRARNGELLQVLRGDEVVAAGIVFPENEVLFSLWMGMPRQYLESPPEAAISALYFFAIRYAFDKGYAAFDFTGTRAFLTDGAYQFKRRWGGCLEDEFSPSAILIKPGKDNGKAIMFFSHMPVLRRTAAGLEAVFVRVDDSTGEPPGEATFARLEKDFGCAGLDRMTVIRISEESESESVATGGGKCQYRLVTCRPGSFAECLARHNPATAAPHEA